MDVTVVMINYNTFDLTKDAIDSIIKYTKGIDYEIYLIDNASSDESGIKLKKLYENDNKIITLIADNNLGTSKAFNLCAKKSKAEYVLWLNSDILIKENFIKKLYDFMQETPNAGVCGGNLLGFDNQPASSILKIKLDYKTLKYNGSILRKIHDRFFKRLDEYNYSNKVTEVEEVIGADMFVRRSIFDKIGYLDEDIFMYGEETEFQYRVKNKTSYKIYSVPYAHMYHLDGGSFSKKKFSPRRYELYLKGTSIYLNKSYGKKYQIKFLKHEKRKEYSYLLLSIFFKEKFNEFKQKLKIIKELLKEYE